MRGCITYRIFSSCTFSWRRVAYTQSYGGKQPPMPTGIIARGQNGSTTAVMCFRPLTAVMCECRGCFSYGKLWIIPALRRERLTMLADHASHLRPYDVVADCCNAVSPRPHQCRFMVQHRRRKVNNLESKGRGGKANRVNCSEHAPPNNPSMPPSRHTYTPYAENPHDGCRRLSERVKSIVPMWFTLAAASHTYRNLPCYTFVLLLLHAIILLRLRS